MVGAACSLHRLSPFWRAALDCSLASSIEYTNEVIDNPDSPYLYPCIAFVRLIHIGTINLLGKFSQNACVKLGYTHGGLLRLFLRFMEVLRQRRPVPAPFRRYCRSAARIATVYSSYRIRFSPRRWSDFQKSGCRESFSISAYRRGLALR